MANGPPEEDPTLLLLLLGGAAIGLGIFTLTGRNGGNGGNGGPIAGPCAPLGDVDGDGIITANDAQLIFEYNAGLRQLSPSQLARADVNRDGRVNSIDAALILQVAERFPGANFRCDLPATQPI